MPDKYITRAEAMTIVNKVLCRIPETEDDLLNSMNIWADNANKNVWYYIPIQEATNSHDYTEKNSEYEKWTKLIDEPDWAKFEVTIHS
jgi:hypothetical protein